MRSLHSNLAIWFFSISAVAALSPGSQNCPILGPVLPAPSSPESSQAVATAQNAFPKALEDAFSAGILDSQTTSFSINVFSASSNASLYNYHYEAPGLNGSLPSGKLDNDTVYRVGSLSKLFTAYAIIASQGNAVLTQPITRYVPELKGKTGNSIDSVQWENVTVGALASHLAGVVRDYGEGDLLDQDLPFAQLGLPTLSNSSKPVCGFDSGLSPCIRAEFFEGIASSHPVTATFHTPLYSNVGYNILGYALESMMNQTYQESLSRVVLEPLKLNRTSTIPPVNDSNIIVPGGLDAVATNQFALDAGYYDAAGGILSTTSDLTALGQSILQSKLLSPAATRAWMKPMTHTSDLQSSVGAPWEISRLQIPVSNATIVSHIVDLYTKSGDIGTYSGLLALDVDHNIGFSILTAGSNASTQRNVLESLIATTWVPALEDAAREEALQSLVGTYSSGNASDNSSITLTLDDDRPGLGISSWTSNDVDVLAAIGANFYGVSAGSNQTFSARLYPTTLVSGNEISFRAVYEALPYPEQVGLVSLNCITWVLVDSKEYGGIGIDDFVFRLDGNGTAVSPRVLRKWLSRETE